MIQFSRRNSFVISSSFVRNTIVLILQQNYNTTERETIY